MSVPHSESIGPSITLRAFVAAWSAALLLMTGGLPACTHYRAGGPTAEESLPPSAKSDPELPDKKKSSLPGEEQVGTVLLVVLLLAAAAGMAYLSFVVIPNAIH